MWRLLPTPHRRRLLRPGPDLPQGPGTDILTLQPKQTIAKLVAIAPKDNEKIKEEPKSPAPTGNDLEDFNKVAENIESSAISSGEIVLAPFSSKEDPLPETSTTNTLDVLTDNEEIVTDTDSELSAVAVKTSEQAEAEDNEGKNK